MENQQTSKVKNSKELQETFPAIYNSILKVFQALHDNKTGLMGLVHAVRKRGISDKDRELINGNVDLQVCIDNFILNTIEKYEKIYGSEPELDDETRNQFEQEIYDYGAALLADYKKGGKKIFERDQKVAQKYFDTNKFRLSGAKVLKYRFYCSCGNAANAFIEMYKRLLDKKEIKPLDLYVLNTTKWNFLDRHIGGHGHTVLCVKIMGHMYAFDPQVFGNREVKFICSDIAVGNSIHHFISEDGNVSPYRIMTIVSPDEYIAKYSDRDTFSKDSTLQNLTDIKEFLDKPDVKSELGEEQIEKYLSELKLHRFKNATGEISNDNRTINQTVKSSVNDR